MDEVVAVENLKIHLTLALLIFKFILLAIHSEPKKKVGDHPYIYFNASLFERYLYSLL